MSSKPAFGKPWNGIWREEYRLVLEERLEKLPTFAQTLCFVAAHS